MNASTASEQERAEMDLLLESGLFDKAPRLGTFFRYICRRYCEGHADEIKEYSIAVEALGRPPDFDPKKDSIVRVEAHRLRKRLEDYYRGPGAAHPIHIVIPNGQYRPHFVPCTPQPQPDSTATTPAATSLVSVEIASLPAAVLTPCPAPRRRWLWLSLALLVFTSAAVLGLRNFHRPTAKLAAAQSAPAAREVWHGSSDPVQGEFRMLAGYHAAPFTDRQGHTWNPDAYFSGAVSLPVPPNRFIEGQPDPHFLKAQRSGPFHYDIPLNPGFYELHLYFAETSYGQGNPAGGGESSRIFRVSINGAVALQEMDRLAEAGAPNRLHERVFKDVVPAADGKLHLSFDPLTGPPLLNALALYPADAGRIRPVRIVAQANPVMDSDGRVWAGDEYALGGNLVFRQNQVLNPPEQNLYQGERYGNFSYHIPLARGKYRLTLHFAETWFGLPASQQPAIGSRIFNVFANRVALLRDFQIAREAGGPNRSLTKVFQNLEPNAQGILLLEFVPVKNYAEINAIEVVETE